MIPNTDDKNLDGLFNLIKDAHTPQNAEQNERSARAAGYNSAAADKLKTKYKFIYFEPIEWLDTGKTKHFDCKNNNDGYSLGIVEWERGWRQYVFSPSGADVIFSVGCLLDIVDFIKQLKAAASL